MPRIDKEIMINAPLHKIFEFMSKPSNLPLIWPSLIEVKDEKQLPAGGYSFRWVYKMAGMRLEGPGEYIEYVPNQWLIVRTEGALRCVITATVRAKTQRQTKVTMSFDYNLPSPLINWLTGNIIIKMNEQEAELILANLKATMETRLKRN
jgi:uncharacterized membrane protein